MTSSTMSVDRRDDMAFYEALLAWQSKNKRTAISFLAAFLGTVVLFTILHAINKILIRFYNRSALIATIARAKASTYNTFNTPRRLAVFHFRITNIAAVLAYLGVNLILILHDRPYAAGLIFIAKRLGWIGICNLALAVFLGLKNTPLSPLAGKSFEALNVVHRVCGWTTILLIVLHAIIHTVGVAQLGVLSMIYNTPGQYAGAAAGVAVILIALTANAIVRKSSYELFYVAHILMVFVILVAAGLHNSQIGLVKQTKIPIIIAGAIWGADKIFRFARLSWSAKGNYCTMTPLPNGATRVTMIGACKSATPGSNAFLWIPGVALLQMHPFTIISNEPVEFVIKARDNFTRKLHHAACEAPGAKWRAAIEGPHGQPPNVLDYDKVVLVAGGSGATYTLALALAWARNQMRDEKQQSLEFILTAKEEANFCWFGPELLELITSANVNVRLYTSSKSIGDPASSSESSHDESLVREISDKELPSKLRQHGFQHGRPDVVGLVRETVASLDSSHRVLIAGCGPAGLVESLQSAVASPASSSGPLVHLHTEKFSF